MTTVINLYAGPGAGKSTTAAGLFSLMKSHRIKVEQVTEFAKELVYARQWRALDNQLYVTAEQDRRMRRLAGEVDFLITDSPLLLGSIYARGNYDTGWMHGACWGLYKSYENFNVLIERVKPYEPYGRRQSEESARAIDTQIEASFGDLMDLRVSGDELGPHRIFWGLRDRGLV